MTEPIDAAPSPPPQNGEDQNYITRDLSSALERVVLLLIERKAAKRGLGRRRAAAEVLQDLTELAHR